MEEVIKEDKNKSHKEFEQLLSEDLGNRSFREGEITTGIVEEIGKKWFFRFQKNNFPHLFRHGI